jgi:hypothetical protein
MFLLRAGLLVGFALAVVGCTSSSAPGKVRGTVTCNGQTVKAGTVYLMYDEGGQYRAEIKSDGSYQFTDLPIGKVVAVVDNQAFNPEQKPQVYGQKQKQIAKGVAKNINEYDAAMGKGGEGPGLAKEKKDELAKVYVKIPKKYTSEKTSPLAFTVARGSQTKDLELTD